MLFRKTKYKYYECIVNLYRRCSAVPRNVNYSACLSYAGARTTACTGQHDAHRGTSGGHERGRVPGERRGGRTPAEAEAEGDAVRVRVPGRRARLPLALPRVQAPPALRAHLHPGLHEPVPVALATASTSDTAGATSTTAATATGASACANGAAAATESVAHPVPELQPDERHSSAEHTQRERFQFGAGCVHA